MDKLIKKDSSMKKYSIKDFDHDFPTDDTCLDWLLKNLYPNGVYCEKCQRITPHYRIEKCPCYSCQECGNQVHPMVGTIFENTRLNHLRLRFKAVALMSVTRCDISSRQLSRDLGITVKTGYRMWVEIRTILAPQYEPKLTGRVEVDETYIGGKATGKRGRGAKNKTIVMGMVERKGKVIAKVIPNVQSKTLLPEIEANVDKTAIVYTDDLPSYDRLNKLGFDHKVVAHSQKIYVTGKDIHTNSAEGFWSQLKRLINGTYHHVTAEHLPEYIDEYAFRYNHRKDEKPMFKTMLGQVVTHSK
jgi:transposase